MPDFLLEVGTEELPATFVAKAMADLEDHLRSRLDEAGLVDSGTGFQRFGTPRRLIVGVSGLKDRQDDRVKESRGPALRAAFDADGNPTGALLGFCRSNGIEPSQIRKDEQYVWASVEVPGKPASELVAEIAPAAIRALTFDKTMRWGSGRMRFARPIRWILATFDGALVPFEVEGVASGTQSRGHRFYAPETFEATSLDALISGLRDRKVEPDPALRQEKLVAEAKAVSSPGIPDLPEALVEENTYLTEWPTALLGSFKEDFAVLPDAVLITAMAKHERMFPVRDEDGKLTRNFVFIRNSGEDDTVRRGNEWVLNARFNDAKFFFDEDAKSTLDDFLEKTRGIVFQQKLGNVRDRADRLSKLSRAIAEATGGVPEEAEFAAKAGLYAKADLATGLVSELSSLQGVIGGEYARREGFPSEVAWAIGSQYDLSKNPDPKGCEAERTAIRLILADQFDKLAGYLGLGLEPTGSSDPFGLRRAATILIEAAWKWHAPLPGYDEFFDLALQGYEGVATLDASGAHAALADLFASRYASLLPAVRHDVLEAAMMREYRFDLLMPRRVKLRTALMTELAADSSLVQTMTRPLNIVASARKKGIPYGFEDPLGTVDASKLESPEGEALLQVLKDQEEELFMGLREEVDSVVTGAIRNLQAQINAFFESTMVMVEDEQVRHARLTLLHAACLQILSAGDFSKLEG